MDIGSRLRRFRNAKQMRLSDLSEKVGLSVSYLSQIENGRESISISKLQQIASALDTKVADLISTPDEADYCIIKHKDRKYYSDSNNGIKEAPLFPYNDCQLETTIIEISPKTSIPTASRHAGEEYTFVIEGSIRIWLDNQSFDLEKGDIIYYKSDLGHRWENYTNKQSTLLVTNTPKTF
ncbi:MAG: hypothetical protein APF76_00570 [Desulfitibacter sp. BRH_c19]|nr:MAG: hypothetical protein APF76_00570 [Desulfitibacter sp. BRH_c19]